MAIPKSNKFYRAVLEVAADVTDVLSRREVAERVTEFFPLTEDDLNDMVPSGRRTRVVDRAYNAINELKNAGLLDSPAKGRFRINPQGREYLTNHPGEIQTAELRSMAQSRDENSAGYQALVFADSPDRADDVTPDELMAISHQQHENMLSNEVLDAVKGVSPPGFEQLVVELLEQMGYGDGRVVGRSGDGGIDGILNQDPLGLEKVFIQAKRYVESARVGEPEIRNFSGSLDPHGATKGIFITTAVFSSTARQTAETISRGGKFIRLIDGPELAQLMIRHHVGVVTEYTYEVKKLDANYFEDV